MIITLVGMTGSGKTTVGKVAAELVKCNFSDTDDLIGYERIKEIFDRFGENAFREAEFSALEKVIANTRENENLIISCGGGIVTYEKSRELIKRKSTAVWIKRNIEISVKNDAVKRPPFCGNADKFKALYEIRRPLYEMTAGYIIENNGEINHSAKKLSELILSLKSEAVNK